MKERVKVTHINQGVRAMNVMNKKGNEEMNENNKLFIEKFETAESSGKTLKELGINQRKIGLYARDTNGKYYYRKFLLG